MDVQPFVYQDYMKLLHDDDYVALYDYYSQETMMGILGVARQENPHSNFIRWLMDMNGEHGYGSLPMRNFLNTVCLVNDEVYEGNSCQNYTDKNNFFSHDNAVIMNEIKYGRYEIIKQSIANEMVLKGQRRADIFAAVKLKFQRFNEPDDIRVLLVIIENKIHSQEHNKQTISYVEDVKTLKVIESIAEKTGFDRGELENSIRLYVYLNAFSNKEIKRKAIEKMNGEFKQFAASSDFITVNYQYLLDGVIEPISHIPTIATTVQRMTDYIRCLGQAKITSMDAEITKGGKTRSTVDNEYLIMAVSSHERKLATQMWEKHHSVILPIIESIFNEVKYNKFLLRDSERDFWISMANLYRFLEIDALQDIVKNSNKCPKFKFNGVEYESRKKRNIGVLARDILCDFLQGHSQKYDVISIRKELQEKLKSNWLREVILLDREIEKIENDYSGYIKTCDSKFKYHTENIEDFKGSFFSDKDMAITLKDGSCAYVAKYWSTDGIERLLKLLDSRYSTSYNKKVERIS